MARTVGQVASFAEQSQCGAQLVESFDYICSMLQKATA